MGRFFCICLGGAAGTGARYLVAVLAARWFGSTFPYGTLIVNTVGCFLIAAVMQAALFVGMSPTLRSAMTIGFIGGLTTYSSFNYETTSLLQDGASALAVLNVAGTVVGGLAAGWLGVVVARQLVHF